MGPGKKRDSQNINIISEIFNTSQQLNTFQNGHGVQAAQLEAAQPNLDVSYLKNTSANPLLNDSINRSQLSGVMIRGGNVGQDTVYGKSHVVDQHRMPEAGVRERLNQRYQASETKEMGEQEEMEGIAAKEEEREEEQLEYWQRDGKADRMTSYRRHGSHRESSGALQAESEGMKAKEHSSFGQPSRPSKDEEDIAVEKPGHGQDTDEEEEIVGEILTSEHDKTNTNILVTQDNSVNLGYKPSVRTANYRNKEQAQIVDEDAGSEARSANQQNAKKLIPFNADDEEDDLNVDDSRRSSAAGGR